MNKINSTAGVRFFLVAVAIVLASCAVLNTASTQFNLEGVKWISPSIAGGEDPRTFIQPQYSISIEGRLLLRYEKLKDHLATIDTTKAIQIQLALTDSSQSALAVSSLKLCPLTKTWMMLATWQLAAPFGNSTWTEPGGDYDTAGCILPTASQPATTALLTYDISTWFMTYPRAGSGNQGLVLINDSTTPITVLGDATSTYAPRILFTETTVSVSPSLSP